MNLDEAIEILSQDLTYTYPSQFNDLQDAQNLGIEALKRVKLYREFELRAHPLLLPGENEGVDNEPR